MQLLRSSTSSWEIPEVCLLNFQGNKSTANVRSYTVVLHPVGKDKGGEGGTMGQVPPPNLRKVFDAFRHFFDACPK